MKRLLALLALLPSLCWSAPTEEVVDVAIDRQLAGFVARPEQYPAIQASVSKLLGAMGNPPFFQVRVTLGLNGNAAVMKSTILVNAQVEKYPEDVREFLIAHELGHLKLGHLRARRDLVISLLPASMEDHELPSHMRVIFPSIQKQALSQELEADAFALRLLVKGGIATKQQVIDTMNKMVSSPSRVHPPQEARVANLVSTTVNE
jgi:Peptidase family M48